MYIHTVHAIAAHVVYTQDEAPLSTHLTTLLSFTTHVHTYVHSGHTPF